jgi:2',3'-cyclic-nucleotide 2'-phosphodiesterase (5'-nucleotidase family)
LRAVLLVLVFAVLALPAAVGAKGDPSEQAEENAQTTQLQILALNDFHGNLEPPAGSGGRIGALTDINPDPNVTNLQCVEPTCYLAGGVEYLATHVRDLEKTNPNSVFVSAGDLIGATPLLSALFHDEPTIEAFNQMGLDYNGVGNHEFDEGIDELLRMQNGGCHPVDGCLDDDPFEGADFGFLAANVKYKDTGETILPPYAIRHFQGIKVAFVGMTLEGTPSIVSPAGIKQADFLDEADSVNALVPVLKRQNVETIIVLLHEGGLQTGTFGECVGISGPIVAIAEQLDPEIDLVVTGHTHQPYICNVPDPKGKPRMVTSASSFGRVVTETNLVIDKRSRDVVRDQVTSTNHLVTRTVAADPALTAIIAKWNAIAAPIANRVVGTITANITRAPNRDAESSLNNLIADAQLAATAVNGAQIALMNPGGVRADLTFAANPTIPTDVPGSVTYGEAFAVQPFGNLLVTMDMTGQQVIDVLEQQAVLNRPGGRNILILGISNGLTFDYQASAPFGARVSNEKLNGVAIDPAAIYKVTVNNFLADGGDAFTVFTQGVNRVGGGDDLAAFTTYLGVASPVAPASIDRINEIP